MQYNFFKETDWSGKGSWYYIWQQYALPPFTQPPTPTPNRTPTNQPPRVEMHVGIIAACLPTLKPLFANFFGQLRTLTKGRTSGGNTGNSGISKPFKSNGYVKQEDSRNGNSYAMKNMSEGSGSRSRDPYGDDVLLGKETYNVNAAGGGARLGRVRSQAGESDESILSHDGPAVGARSSLARGMTIVRTTEVNISR